MWPVEECVVGGFVCKSDRGLSISLALNVHFRNYLAILLYCIPCIYFFSHFCTLFVVEHKIMCIDLTEKMQ